MVASGMLLVQPDVAALGLLFANLPSAYPKVQHARKRPALYRAPLSTRRRRLKTKWHVATAAEAIAAAQFARLGFNVSVQYGANQPEYDLMIDDGSATLKVSVKGSRNKGWGLSHSHLPKLGDKNYHSAADSWLEGHKTGTIICLVQFSMVEFDQMPRIYVASPSDVAARLRAARGGLGHTILWEDHQYGQKGAAAGTVERLPDEWRLAKDRMDELVLVLGLSRCTP
jgi:Holliday junction resolvase-like predicted endonuclease